MRPNILIYPVLAPIKLTSWVGRTLKEPNNHHLILNIDTNDKFKAPPPTESEVKLRSVLKYKKIPFKHSQVIWYTGCNEYTPDLIVGERLIIEVDGKFMIRNF